jgi:hypothetical protein
MTPQEFIDAIRITVVESAIESVKSNLMKPPGREPSQKLIEMSEWFSKLEN